MTLTIGLCAILFISFSFLFSFHIFYLEGILLGNLPSWSPCQYTGRLQTVDEYEHEVSMIITPRELHNESSHQRILLAHNIE
jgi:hypothetical protein